MNRRGLETTLAYGTLLLLVVYVRRDVGLVAAAEMWTVGIASALSLLAFGTLLVLVALNQRSGRSTR